MWIPAHMRFPLLSLTILILTGCPGDSPPVEVPNPNEPTEQTETVPETISSDTETLNFAGIPAPAGKRWLQCDQAPGGRGQKDIGPQGDTILVGAHMITVPQGAVTERVRFTVVEPADRFVQLVLTAAPNVRFQQPVEIRVSYRRCTNTPVREPDMHRATSSGVQPVANQQHIPADSVVVGQVNQFSNFALATN